ncbi:MAG: hypothetical protein J0M33_27060 [Anaerolineae bacterium]|nr:hypothetical protein [Anaerolineae bacterium]
MRTLNCSLGEKLKRKNKRSRPNINQRIAAAAVSYYTTEGGLQAVHSFLRAQNEE